MSGKSPDKAFRTIHKISAFVQQNGLQTVGWVSWLTVLAFSLTTTALGLNVVLDSSDLARALTLSCIIQLIQAISVLTPLWTGRHRPKWLIPIAFLAYLLCLLTCVRFSLSYWLQDAGTSQVDPSLIEALMISFVVELLIVLVPRLLYGLGTKPHAKASHPLVPDLEWIRPGFSYSSEELARLYVQFINAQAHSEKSPFISPIFRSYVDLSNRFLILPKDWQDPNIDFIRACVQAAEKGKFQLVSTEMRAKTWAAKVADRKYLIANDNRDGEDLVLVYRIPKGLMREIVAWDFIGFIENNHQLGQSGNGKSTAGDHASD